MDIVTGRLSLLIVAMITGRTLACAAAAIPEATAAIEMHPSTIDTAGGERSVEMGLLRTPALHASPSEATLAIPFRRFRSTSATPGSPLFLLAGGPGNTYLDDLAGEISFNRWLDKFLEIGDVVLLEQRGAETTPYSMLCPLRAELDPDQPLTAAIYRKLICEHVVECRKKFAAGEIPLQAFSIVQMARDYHRLRELLGYKQFNLLGGSFGSQLGLTILSIDAKSVDRAVFYGVEGPMHTLDSPLFIAGHIARVAAAINQNWQPRLLLGDFEQKLHELVAALEREPIVGTVTGSDGKLQQVAFGAFDLKFLLWSADGLKGDRESIEQIGRLMMAVELGQTSYLLKAKLELIERLAGDQGQPMNLMTFLVDCASVAADPEANAADSGSDQRPWIFDREVVDSGLTAACECLDVPPLDARFLQLVQADNQILLIAGGLDGYTPPEYAESVAIGLPNAHRIYVPWGDHNGWQVLEFTPALRQRTLDFLAGRVPAASFPQVVNLPPLRVELLPTWIIVVVGLITTALGVATILLMRRLRRRRRASRQRSVSR